MDEILTVLNYIHLEGESKPSIYIGSWAEKELMRLKEEFENPDAKSSIVLIVRCWNKSREEITALLTKVKQIQGWMADIKGLIISVNSDKDTFRTIDSVEMEVREKNLDIPIIPLGVENYSWTAGLNGPIALLSKLFAFSKSKIGIFCMSFDVEFNEDNARKINKAWHLLREKNVIIATRGSDVDDKIMCHHKNYFLGIAEAIKNGKSCPSIPNGIVATARNTATIWPIAHLTALCGFNPLCNGMGGMEDYEFLLRFLLSMYEKNGSLADCISHSGAVYTDSAWNNMSENNRQNKTVREIVAFEQIIEMLRFSSLSVALEDQDFRF
jgi:hypothetical protein